MLVLRERGALPITIFDLYNIAGKEERCPFSFLRFFFSFFSFSSSAEIVNGNYNVLAIHSQMDGPQHLVLTNSKRALAIFAAVFL